MPTPPPSPTPGSASSSTPIKQSPPKSSDYSSSDQHQMVSEALKKAKSDLDLSSVGTPPGSPAQRRAALYQHERGSLNNLFQSVYVSPSRSVTKLTKGSLATLQEVLERVCKPESRAICSAVLGQQGTTEVCVQVNQIVNKYGDTSTPNVAEAKADIQKLANLLGLSHIHFQ